MKKDLVIAVIISLTIGLGGGYVIASATESADDSSTKMSDHSSGSGEHNDSSTMQHGHSGTYDVDASDAPTVSFIAEEDAKSGWNITIETTDFEFAPTNVNTDNVLGEGHAHLYVDGEKIARLYSPYFHYDGSFDGTKTFRVTLNANDHSEYAVDGEVIDSSQEVTHNSHQ